MFSVSFLLGLELLTLSARFFGSEVSKSMFLLDLFNFWIDNFTKHLLYVLSTTSLYNCTLKVVGR
jgi:hypothetical protein